MWIGRVVIGLVLGLGAVLSVQPATAADTVSDYLRAGWEIKGVGQATVKETLLVLQKGDQITFCLVDFFPDASFRNSFCRLVQ